MRPNLGQGLGQGRTKNPGGTAGSQNLASKATAHASVRLVVFTAIVIDIY